MEPDSMADYHSAPEGVPGPTNHTSSPHVADVTNAARPVAPASTPGAVTGMAAQPPTTTPGTVTGMAAQPPNTTPGDGPASGSKPRAQKTPYQKEALEAAYKLNSHPTEEMRRVLGEKIGLSEQQVATWFNHRRRKERKESTDALAVPFPAAANSFPTQPSPSRSAAVAAAPATAAAAPHTGPATNSSNVGAASSPPLAALAAVARGPAMRPAADDEDGGCVTEGTEAEYSEEEEEEEEEPDFAELQRLQELRELLEVAKGTLDVPFQEDGPPLGFEFDDIPLGTGTAICPRKSGGEGVGGKRRRGEDDPDFEFGPRKRAPSKPKLAVSGVDLSKLQQEEEVRAAMLAEKARVTQERLETAIKREQDRLWKEKERTDVRIAKEREKEISRLEAERKKHMEKMVRDQKKEEERKLKEAARLRQLQEKEQRKLMAQLEKEKKAEERKKALEEKKKEKEMLKALQQQERNAMRLRARAAGEAGPKDDADFEWEALVAEYRAQHGLPADDPLPQEGAPPPAGLPPLPARPPFPPPSVHLIPAFPPEVGDKEGGELLTAWSFVASFGDLIGMKQCTVDQLLAAVATGASSQLLSSLHIGLLRLIQADAEEALASGALQTHADPGQVHSAQLLEESWAWGFDVDAWRAHLNPLTWPEVARQLAIAAGLGRKRPKPKKEEKPKLGQEGEDIVVDEQGGLKLKLPPRLAVGSVKAAAWQVLAEAGPAGMRVEEIARRIQKLGLRDLRTSRTPEASVAGALGRDMLFARVAPATYALQAILAYHQKLQQQQGGGEGPEGAAVKSEGVAAKTEGDAPDARLTLEEGTAVTSMEGVKSEGVPDAGNLGSPRGINAGKIEVVKSEPGEGVSQEQHEEHDEDESEEEEEERNDEDEGATWIRALEGSEYDSLPLELRISLLASVCDLAMMGPTVRDMLERRLEEQQRIKKQIWEENKAEKRRKQVEAAAKAKAAAEEAQRALEKYRATSVGPEGGRDAAGAADEGAEGAGVAASAAAEPPVAASPQPGAPQDSQQGSPEQQGPPATAGVAAAESGSDAQADPHTAAAMAIAAAERTLGRAGETEEERAAARHRQAQRAEQVRRELEANSMRLEPLGMDRRYNKYWRFVIDGTEAPRDGEAMDVDGGRDEQQRQGNGSASEDACSGRLFFESGEDGSLKVICTPEDLDALIEALERRGAREGGLYASLVRCKDAVQRAMPEAPLALPAPPVGEEQLQLLEERANALMACVPVGAMEVAGTAGTQDLEEESAELLHLKAGLLMVLAALPKEALPKDFGQRAWRESVESARSPLDLRGALGHLEEAMSGDYISPAFHRRPLLVKGAWLPTGNEVASALPGSTAADLALPDAAGGGGGAGAVSAAAAGGLALAGQGTAAPAACSGGADATLPLAWLPATSAAVGLRLLALDASLFYRGGAAPARERLEAYKYIQRPAPPEAATETVSGLPITAGGRVKATLLPPFPARLLFGPRVEFSFPITQFQKDWATGSSATIAPPPKKGVGKGRGRGRGGGRGSRGGGRGGGMAGVPRPSSRAASGQGRINKSALAKEFANDGSDSERHYGTDFDEEDDDEFASAPPQVYSHAPSAAPSEGMADEDQDEEISDAEDQHEGGDDSDDEVSD